MLHFCQNVCKRKEGEVQRKKVELFYQSLQSTPLWYFFAITDHSSRKHFLKKVCFIGFSGKGNWAENKFHSDLHGHAKIWSLMSCCKSSLKTVLVTAPRTPISEITAMSHSWPWPQIQPRDEGEGQWSLLPSHRDFQEQPYCHLLPHLNLQVVHHMHFCPPFEVSEWPG